MRKNALNIVIFLFLAGGLFFLYQQAGDWFPKPEKKKDETAKKIDEQKKTDEHAKKDKDKDAKPPEGPKEQPKVAAFADEDRGQRLMVVREKRRGAAQSADGGGATRGRSAAIGIRAANRFAGSSRPPSVGGCFPGYLAL